MTESHNNSTSSDRQREFQNLVDAHYRSVWQYVVTLTRGSAEAEDLTHQAFLLAFDRMVEKRPIDDPGLWLRGVVRNLVREWWRKNRRLPVELADQLCRLAEEVDSASDELRSERETALASCLEKLSDDERRIVRARYEDGLPITEIAQRHEINVRTARVRLFRIRERLNWRLHGGPSNE
ncbi:MAG: sigma-70 family RNA polymerase sigma factor [Planctomycetota bacterium]|nr:sigma-70 family RNA polymerase sigma factor [Planctomycetota bacterium]